MRKTLFRQEAIEAASRLDDLQTNIRVARPATVLTAGALAVALVGSTVASAFVDVPIHVEGVGVFVTESGTLEVPVMTLSAGYVSDLAITNDQFVATGDLLARLTLPDREAEIVKSGREVAAMRRDLEIRQQLSASDAEVEARSKDRQRTAIQTRISGLRAKVETLSKRLEGLGKLQTDGVISLVALQTAEITYQEALDELSSAETDLLALAASREEAASARKRELLAAEAALEQAELELEAAKSALESDATIVAPTGGTITSINTQLGALTSPGAPVFEISPGRAGLSGPDTMHGVIFVPFEQGKRVLKDDLVLINPADLPEGISARVVARVVDISDVPASSARLTQVLGDDVVVQKVSEQGPVFEVTVAPERTAGGDLVWRSAKPDGVEPDVGTPLSARITVEHRPLLALAIPAFRALLGADENPWAVTKGPNL